MDGVGGFPVSAYWNLSGAYKIVGKVNKIKSDG